ncbi:MAG: transglutaminase family protein [Cyanobacteria bacterium J069]|nr:MAG: transglutaminase family protein [Cyanobacteria bacterium J069]
MRYWIRHTTTYRYDRPVTLAPHWIRLRPRSDVTQVLHDFSLTVEPAPERVAENLDLEGNSVIKLTFPNDTLEEFKLTAVSEVETFRTNPFDFLLEPWASRLPIDYPISLHRQLQPYLQTSAAGLPAIDAIALQLANDLWLQTEGNPVLFLSELNQQIHANCCHIIRATGEPFPPGITWSKEAGSCRDLTVLFMEVCRALGLAARFVSGYQEADAGNDPELHAWAEVYLPGAGWRGYDPTQNAAVGDRYIALVASSFYRDAAPISGTLKTGIGAASEMHNTLEIEARDESAGN